MKNDPSFVKLMQVMMSILEDAKMDILDCDYRSACAKITMLQKAIQEGLEKEEDDA